MNPRNTTSSFSKREKICRNPLMFDGAGELEPLPLPPDIAPFDEPDWRVASSRRLLREFRRGIREGGSPAPNFADGLGCQRVLDAIRESAGSGRTVDL